MRYKEVSLPKMIGKGYKTFWNFKGRYRVCKGSRASKKSKTTALWYMYHLSNPKYSDANLLVVRKVFRTLKDSCFTDLKWAAKRLGVDYLWEFKESPLEVTNIKTGQKILFRGLDDSLKITSITVEHGYLCWGWIEESYEITKEKDFDTLDESIRGEIPEPLFKQWTITFNPWNDRHWLKKKFFDVKGDPDILAMTTNYLCNEWLDETDLNLFERMKKNNPKRYQVAGLGNWGVVDGLVYENWHEENYDLITKKDYMQLDTADKELKNYVFRDDLKSVFGLDFGYTNDPTALFVGFLDLEHQKLYVWDEMYEKGLSNARIGENIKQMGYGKEHITGDSAEPKSIDELHNTHGLRIKGASKGKDSIMNGVQWIQNLEIIVHPRCNNFLTEISNYTWDSDKFGNKLNRPIDDFNHLMDAMRYGCEKYIRNKKWIY